MAINTYIKHCAAGALSGGLISFSSKFCLHDKWLQSCAIGASLGLITATFDYVSNKEKNLFDEAISGSSNKTVVNRAFGLIVPIILTTMAKDWGFHHKLSNMALFLLTQQVILMTAHKL